MTGSSDSGHLISLQGGWMIYLGTFSKSLLPSLRISYMILPLSLMEKAEKKGGIM